jgi:hypothetical protein
MKNLGKVLIFILLTIASAQTFAQRIGIQGGLNLSNMLIKDDAGTYSDEFKMNPGFNAGVTLEIGLGKLLSAEVGAIADTKGFKWALEGGTMKANLIFVDVPVLLRVGPQFGPIKVFAAAGPYFGVGITGKRISKPDGGSKTTEDIKWGNSENEDLKRLDYGAKFGAGAEFASFTFGAYYSLGLANLETVTDGGAKTSTRVLSLCVGYKF